jgi:hypothetical protein
LTVSNGRCYVAGMATARMVVGVAFAGLVALASCGGAESTTDGEEERDPPECAQNHICPEQGLCEDRGVCTCPSIDYCRMIVPPYTASNGYTWDCCYASADVECQQSQGCTIGGACYACTSGRCGSYAGC